MRISDWSSDVCSSDLGGRCIDAFDELIVAVVVKQDGVIELHALFGAAQRMHDDLAVGIGVAQPQAAGRHGKDAAAAPQDPRLDVLRSEEHTSELQSLMRISYAVFCLKKKTDNINMTMLDNVNTIHEH